MKIDHKDYCTHINNKEDKDVLTRPLFDVNMRLLKSSPQYREIINSVCNYLIWWATTPKDGYKYPHGVSGANAGIPFNIICINRGKVPVIMINPKITRRYGYKIESFSNCGSLTLEEPIKIYRDEFIDFNYYDLKGNMYYEDEVGRGQQGLTIQHEVEHNLGILILDKTKY